jgi:hypothetical protein
MSDLSVSERRIRPIQDAVASENWKQALQLCDKWSKKGERSDRFLVVQQHITRPHLKLTKLGGESLGACPPAR